MSYILDALKKSQTEQAGDGVALRVQRPATGRSTSTWLATGLVLVLLFNLGLMLWIFVINNPQPETKANLPEATAPDQSASETTKEAPVITTPVATSPPQTARPPTPISSPPAPKPEVVAIALRELPTTEQVLYRSFNYSSHIYTDDPSLCAIVIDGQRLKAGDAFKGLKVIAITESGIVFEENRRGQTRQVAVSIIELWDDFGG